VAGRLYVFGSRDVKPRGLVAINVQLGPRKGAAPKVVYRWDPDTDILSVQLRPARSGTGAAGSGSVELEGADGSWVALDVVNEEINGLEIVVWPQVSKKSGLVVPADVREGVVRLASGGGAAGVTSMEVDTPMMAESDVQERNFHFRLGVIRACTVVRVGRDLLLEVDAANHVAGLWLLNVPPFPQEP
jgi:hypothetical protein